MSIYVNWTYEDKISSSCAGCHINLWNAFWINCNVSWLSSRNELKSGSHFLCHFIWYVFANRVFFKCLVLQYLLDLCMGVCFVSFFFFLLVQPINILFPKDFQDKWQAKMICHLLILLGFKIKCDQGTRLGYPGWGLFWLVITKGRALLLNWFI